MELGGFGVERGVKKAMWEEATREICNMMTEVPYQGFQGEFFSMPPRNVIPKPLQKPHPPLWVAASRRETTMMAGRLGMGSLGFGFETPEELQERSEEYYRLIREECFPIGHAVNPALAVLGSFMMGDSDEQAIERSANGPAFFSYSLGYYYSPQTGTNHPPGEFNVYKNFLDNTGMANRQHEADESKIRDEEKEYDEIQRALFRAARSRGIVGTSESIYPKLKLYEDAHLDVLIFTAQSGDRKHEHIMESIEKFGKELLPEFKDRHEKDHRKWRAKQLEGVDFPINSSI
jgi:alkanesulfonate monooxygenase SsuD/methylene tetrahydromethanopterin reductase-like flavin-dependent oxidoreductase (luciferase family)